MRETFSATQWRREVEERFERCRWVATYPSANGIRDTAARHFVLQFDDFPSGFDAPGAKLGELAWLARDNTVAHAQFRATLQPPGKPRRAILVQRRFIESHRGLGKARWRPDAAEIRVWDSHLLEFLNSLIKRRGGRDPDLRRKFLMREVVKPLLRRNAPARERDYLLDVLGEAKLRWHVAISKAEIYPVVQALVRIGVCERSRSRNPKHIWTADVRAKIFEALCTRPNGRPYIDAVTFAAML